VGNAREIAATGLLDATQGVYIGGWVNTETKRLEYLRHNGPEHILAFAPTRSGKGVALVIPTLLVWNESAVIYDIKGENWERPPGSDVSKVISALNSPLWRRAVPGSILCPS